MTSGGLKHNRWNGILAERVGFEPTLEFPLNTLSKRAPSATRPSLRSECEDSNGTGRTSLDNLGSHNLGSEVEATSAKASCQKQKEPLCRGSWTTSTRIARTLPSLFVVFLFVDVLIRVVLSFLDLGPLFGGELAIRFGFRLGRMDLRLFFFEFPGFVLRQFPVPDPVRDPPLLVPFPLIDGTLCKQ